MLENPHYARTVRRRMPRSLSEKSRKRVPAENAYNKQKPFSRVLGPPNMPPARNFQS